MESSFPLTVSSTSSNASQENMSGPQFLVPAGLPTPTSTTVYTPILPYFYPPPGPPLIPPPFQPMPFSYTHLLQQPCPPFFSPPPPPPSQFPLYPVPLCFRPNVTEFGGSSFLQPNVPPVDTERRALDAYNSKAARNNRKLARQKSLIIKGSSSGANSAWVDTRQVALRRRISTMNSESKATVSNDLYTFCTPDNKRLRLLLSKELKNSDVGTLGRIVLPKREVEQNLPTLNDKDGILLALSDVYSNQVWTLKFKYWSNNKSRMYVLENTGEFVRQNGLKIGDILALYKDENENFYYSIRRVVEAAAGVMDQSYGEQANENEDMPYMPSTYEARDEEEASLALLVDQLNEREQEEQPNNNNLVSLVADVSAYSSQREREEAETNTSSCNVDSIGYHPLPADDSSISQPPLPANTTGPADQNMDDWYDGLGMLPDADMYTFFTPSP